MSNARLALLDKVLAHAAANGLSDTSLRDLADAVGTSHRMLLYHFGSREGLVAAVVQTIEAQQRDALRAIAADASSAREVVAAQWAQLSAPDMAPLIRLFFEVVAQALFARPGTEGFVEELITPWLEVGEEVGERLGATVRRDELRLGIAVVRGLLLDVVATGDRAGATAALERFLELWERGADPG